MRDAADRSAELEIDRIEPGLASGVEPLLLTIPQAARVLAVGRTTVYELIGAGELEAVHIGRSVRVPVVAVRAFVVQQRVSR